MTLERVELFSTRRELLLFLLTISIIFCVSIWFRFLDYHDLTRFDTAVREVHVVNQYLKTKKGRTYSVLKLKLDDGGVFYTTGSKHYRNLIGRTLRVELNVSKLTFAEYLQGFFSYIRIKKIYPELSFKERFNRISAAQHEAPQLQQLYGALFWAAPMSKELRETFSALGVSHLLAISGFHLGVLSGVLFFLLRSPYRFMQERWFPYRHGNRDLFLVVAVLLGGYLWLLDFVPSLLRAFTMMLIGFVLYDRGVKVLSFQTLFLTVVLLLALWPMLLFSIGFWLSVSGVFYIFLFLLHFSHWSSIRQFIVLHGWVYVMMLPFALYLFETFSQWHVLSIVWTMLFVLFYPLVLLLHLIGLGDLLDLYLLKVLESDIEVTTVVLPLEAVVLHIALSFLAIRYKIALGLLAVVSIAVFVKAVYEIA